MAISTSVNSKTFNKSRLLVFPLDSNSDFDIPNNSACVRFRLRRGVATSSTPASATPCVRPNILTQRSPQGGTSTPPKRDNGKLRSTKPAERLNSNCRRNSSRLRLAGRSFWALRLSRWCRPRIDRRWFPATPLRRVHRCIPHLACTFDRRHHTRT